MGVGCGGLGRSRWAGVDRDLLALMFSRGTTGDDLPQVVSPSLSPLPFHFGLIPIKLSREPNRRSAAAIIGRNWSLPLLPPSLSCSASFLLLLSSLHPLSSPLSFGSFLPLSPQSSSFYFPFSSFQTRPPIPRHPVDDDPEHGPQPAGARPGKEAYPSHLVPWSCTRCLHLTGDGQIATRKSSAPSVPAL